MELEARMQRCSGKTLLVDMLWQNSATNPSTAKRNGKNHICSVRFHTARNITEQFSKDKYS